MLCVSCFVWLVFFVCFRKICLNKSVHAFWLPVSSSHLTSVPPNWQRHATKKVRSFIPCHFIIFGERSDPPRNLRVPDFRDLGSRPRTSRPRNLPRARIKNSQRPPRNMRDKVIHILKRMWGLPVHTCMQTINCDSFFNMLSRFVEVLDIHL